MCDEVCPLNDVLVRGIAADGAVLACAAIATGTTEEARVRHGTSPTATAALGRTLVAAAMLASGLKGRQSVMIRVLGDGPLGPMIAESTADGLLRGYVTNPQADLPPTPARKLDVGGAVGRGTFYVTRDVGLRDPYHSSVPLVTGEIGDDLAEYLKCSEQIPSVVAIGVLVGARDGVLASGGLLLQVMPGAPPTIPAYLEERAKVLPAVTQMVTSGASPDEMLRVALGDLPLAVRERRPVRFACRCSPQKVANVIVALGREEADRILRDEGRVEVQCRFCGEQYVLSTDDVDAVFAGQD